MLEIIDYKLIVTGEDMLLSVQVQEEIAAGWQPLGRPFVDHGGDYCQAMVRYKKPDPAEWVFKCTE